MEIESTFNTYPLPIRFIDQETFKSMFSDFLKTNSAKENLFLWFRDGTIHKDSDYNDIFYHILSSRINECEKVKTSSFEEFICKEFLTLAHEDSLHIVEKIKEYVKISTGRDDEDYAYDNEKEGKKEKNTGEKEKKGKIYFSISKETSSNIIYKFSNQNDILESLNKEYKNVKGKWVKHYFINREINPEIFSFISSYPNSERYINEDEEFYIPKKDAKMYADLMVECIKEWKLNDLTKRENKCFQEEDTPDLISEEKEEEDKNEEDTWKSSEKFSSSLDIPDLKPLKDIPDLESQEEIEKKIEFTIATKEFSKRGIENLRDEEKENFLELQKQEVREKYSFIRNRLYEDFGETYDRHFKPSNNPSHVKEEFLSFLYERWNYLQKDREKTCLSGWKVSEERKSFQEGYKKIHDNIVQNLENILKSGKYEIQFEEEEEEEEKEEGFKSAIEKERENRNSDFLEFQKEKEEFEKKLQELRKEKDDLNLQKEKSRQLARKRRKEFEIYLEDMDESLKETYEEHERFKEEMIKLDEIFLKKKEILEDMKKSFNIDPKNSSFENLSDIALFEIFSEIFEKNNITSVSPLRIIFFRNNADDRGLFTFVNYFLCKIEPKKFDHVVETKKLVEVYKTVDCLLKKSK